MGEVLDVFCFPEQCAVLCQVDQGECFTVNVDISVEGLKGEQRLCSKCSQHKKECKCTLDLQISPPLLSSKKRLYRECVLCIPAIMWSKCTFCRYSCERFLMINVDRSCGARPLPSSLELAGRHYELLSV